MKRILDVKEKWAFHMSFLEDITYNLLLDSKNLQ